jgi:hypothetical protein
VIGMMSRNTNGFGQSLADKVPATSRRLEFDHIRSNVGQALRIDLNAQQCLPQNQDPSSDGQQASPSAVLPVHFCASMAHPSHLAPHPAHRSLAHAAAMTCIIPSTPNKGPAYVQ